MNTCGPECVVSQAGRQIAITVPGASGITSAVVLEILQTALSLFLITFWVREPPYNRFFIPEECTL